MTSSWVSWSVSKDPFNATPLPWQLTHFDAPDGKRLDFRTQQKREDDDCFDLIEHMSSRMETHEGAKLLLHPIKDKPRVIQGRALVNLVTHIAFWKKKETAPAPEAKRIIPLPNLPSSTLDTQPLTSPEAVNKARESLKVLKLERQILGSAVTTIYESHSSGVITEAERDRMLEKYKVDLKRLEKTIQENQEIVDLHDLEIERDEVIKSFKAKLAEIDAKLKSLKSGAPAVSGKPEPSGRSGDTVSDSGSQHSNHDQHSKDKENEEAITESEKRIDQIREEILKAMDRLEQIEAEG